MRRRTISRIIITALPLAVLLAMYGLWLFLDPPIYYESIIAATLVLGIFAAIYIRLVPSVISFYCDDVATIEKDELHMRTKRKCGAREILVLLSAIIVFRVAVILLGYWFFNKQFGYTCTFFSAQRMWSMWSDAPHYMAIAEHGYVAQSTASESAHLTLVFLPFYSYVTKIFAFSGNYIRSGYFVSHISTIIGCVMLYQLVKIDFDRKTARRAVKYFCILPAACLLYATMSDGMFFMLSVTALYCARKKYIPLASLFSALAAYTRIIGVVLFLPIAMEYVYLLLQQRKQMDVERWKFVLKQTLCGLSLLLIPLAIGFYMLQNYAVSGNALQFMTYQNENWSQSFSIFFRTPAYLTDYMIRDIASGNTAYVFGLSIPNLVYIFGSLSVLLISINKMRVSYVAYFLAYFFIATSVSWLLSGPRYLTCCFPLILGLALVTKKKYVDIPLTIISLLGLVLYLYGFINGYQVF